MVKQNKRRKIVLTCLVLIIIAAAAVIYIPDYYRLLLSKKAYYYAYGIEIPSGYNLHGIDVSRYQGVIYWQGVKKMEVNNTGIDFVFMKATEGLVNVDNQFKRNWRQAEEYNIPHGAYHFFIATKSGKQQAQHYIHNVPRSSGTLRPVLDIEELYGVSPQNMRKEVLAWLQTVEAYYGVKPIIYTYVNFYDSYLGKDFDNYPLWVAHYLQKEKPRISRDWLFWQHSESGRVNGINTKVDFNVFKGDSTDFKKLLIP